MTGPTPSGLSQDGQPSCLPEPPDGTRIEFEFATDVYAAHRDDESSARAGWQVGDGGETWCLYGSDVPKTWAALIAEFDEESLRLAVRLMPVAEDIPNRRQWPTEIYWREDHPEEHDDDPS